MLALSVVALFAAFPHAVQAHGAVSKPAGRAFRDLVNCPFCTGSGDFYDSNPYGTVNRNVTPSSPCFGSKRGDAVSTRSNWGPYQIPWESGRPTYSQGETFEANVVIDADHAGDTQWQICPYGQAETDTEECFGSNRITEWKEMQCFFGKCNAGPHEFDRQSYTEKVTIPTTIPAGGATLRWLWVSRWTNEVYRTCIDVDISSGESLPTPPPTPKSTPFPESDPTLTQPPTLTETSTPPPPESDPGRSQPRNGNETDNETMVSGVCAHDVVLAFFVAYLVVSL